MFALSAPAPGQVSVCAPAVATAAALERRAAAAALPCAGVWRASEADTALPQPVWPSGHKLLDAQLPGGGWPCGALTEVLQAQPSLAEWQLVLPALVGWQRHIAGAADRPRAGVVLVGPPHMPLLAGLQAQGLLTASLLTLTPGDPAQRLWACEQALHSPAVGAVLAWLPHAPLASLRRLQLAATRSGGLLWVFRPWQAQQTASPAVLRLRVDGWSAQGGLQLAVLKRRGPPLAPAIELVLPYAGLRATLAASAWRQAQRRAANPMPLVVPHAGPKSATGPVLRPAPGSAPFSDLFDHAAVVARPVSMPV